MSRLAKLAHFFTGSPAPVPPVQLGPYATEQEAREAARQADMRYAAWLDVRRGFMEVVAEDDHWVVQRRAQDKPSWLLNQP